MVPAPVALSMISPSPEKKVLAPPHFVSISTPSLAARKEPDWISRGGPPTSSATRSPGRAGATVTSPPSPEASNLLMKKLSPPSTERFSPFMRPPRTSDFISMVSDMLTIAPASACMRSPARN